MNELLLIIAAYCIGSVPTAVWVSRYFFNIDIRDYGSGNAGATNTFPGTRQEVGYCCDDR
jgi:glycerol-3-phosphate acyltransferase PlsY